MEKLAATSQYLHIARDLAARIAKGEFPEGEKLFGRSMLASEYAVSPETVRRALRLLADMKVVEIKAQSGAVILSVDNARRYLANFEENASPQSLLQQFAELLDRYDKLFGRGHFSLYRNCPLINGLYRTEVDGKPLYREIFQDEKSRLFDEWTGIDRIFQIRGIPIYDSPVVADIQSASYHFMVNSDREDQERPQVFFWRETEGRGRIFRYYRDHGEIVRQEFMYIHLQKRDMTAADEIDGDFLIVPNEFISGRGLAPYLDDPETEDEVAAAMIRTYYRRRLVNWQQVRKNMARRLRKAGRLWKKDGRK